MLGHRTRRPARAAAVAAASVLALAACGSSDEGTPVQGSSALAASVDGHEITVGEVQQTTRELTTILQASGQGQQISAGEVVNLLVQVPGVLEFGEQQDLQVPSAGSVRQSLEAVLPSPSDVTVDFMRANSLNSQLDETTRQELTAFLTEQDVTISPRYGSAVGQSPDWLEETAEEQLPMGS